MTEKIQAKKNEWLAEKDIFFTCLFIGILTHGYMMTNKLPNIDDYISMFHYGGGYTSGRWFLALLGNLLFRLDGNYSLPFFNGSIFIILLSLACTIFLKAFDFQSRWVKRVFASLFIAFPTITATFGYMFTAPFYGFAILLMAVAFYLLIQYKYGFLDSIILICCSLGIYQAYWGLLAGFLLLYLITQCIEEETSPKEIIYLSLKSLLTLLLGIVLYLLVNNIMLKVQNLNLSSYQGLDDMGQFSFSQIPSMLRNAYGSFFGLIRNNYLYITWYPIVRIIIACGFLLTLVFCVITCIQRRKQWLKVLAIVLFTVLFPLAVNAIYIMYNDATSIHTLMCYSVVLVFLVPFIFLKGSRIRMLCKYGYTLLLVIVAILYVRFANIYYLNLELAYTESYSFMETLYTRIQDVENYSADKKVMFYGQYNHNINRNIWELRMVNQMVGTVDIPNIVNSSKLRLAFSRIYLGSTFYEVSDISLLGDDISQLNTMPSYPDDGSIAIINDIVVIKLSN